jgi:hypothetical protein
LHTITGGRFTSIRGAGIAVVAVLGRSAASHVGTHIIKGAGVVVVARQGIGPVYAALLNNGNIRVICADIPVIAAPEHPGHADAVRAIIAVSAAVPVSARRCVVGEHASIHSVAGVGGADIVVVAGHGRTADTDAIGTRVVQGAGIEIGTSCPIGLSCA